MWSVTYEINGVNLNQSKKNYLAINNASVTSSPT